MRIRESGTNVASVTGKLPLVIALVVCGLSCTSPLRDLKNDPGMAEMRVVQDADAERALEAALARNDRRFLGVATMALEIPGPDEAYLLAHEKYGVREINGGGDHGLTEERRRMIRGALDFASRYNTLLLRHLRETGREEPIPHAAPAE